MIAYSGGASAFTNAYGMLSAADQARIGIISYVSPGANGVGVLARLKEKGDCNNPDAIIRNGNGGISGFGVSGGGRCGGPDNSPTFPQPPEDLPEIVRGWGWVSLAPWLPAFGKSYSIWVYVSVVITAMFNPVEPESPSFGRWVAQLFGSMLVPMFVLLKTAALVKPESVLLEYLTFALSSACLAVIVYLVKPVCVTEGVKVWIVPVMLEVLAAAYDLRVGENITSLFYGEGEGGWAMVMLTFPVFGSCVYSLAMWVVHRKLRRVA